MRPILTALMTGSLSASRDRTVPKRPSYGDSSRFSSSKAFSRQKMERDASVTDQGSFTILKEETVTVERSLPMPMPMLVQVPDGRGGGRSKRADFEMGEMA